MRGHLRFTSASLAAVALLLGACSDDDPATAGATTTEAGGEATTSTAGAGGESTTSTAGEAEEGGLEELCALAEDMFNQEDFPSVEQLTQYQELAPEEIADAVATAAAPLIAADGDPVATLVAFAEDDVEAAIEQIDAFEAENCGIEHEPAPAEEQTTVDPGATQVDVVASEYDFELPAELTAGRTSFVMTNSGEEAHFMFIAQIAEGHTIEEALVFEGDPEEAGIVTDFGVESGLAAPGGEDEEVITVDLPAGNFAMLCFLPGPDGTPHAFTGMAVPFTAACKHGAETGHVDVVAHLDAPHPTAAVFAVVDDLGTYPDWLDIVARAVPDDDGSWLVDLRGRLGPFARSKRLRMARGDRTEGRLVVFERAERDGRGHSPWVLRAEVEPDGDDACRLTMHLHYGGGLWGPVLERLLGDAIEHSRPRLLALLDAGY